MKLNFNQLIYYVHIYFHTFILIFITRTTNSSTSSDNKAINRTALRAGRAGYIPHTVCATSIMFIPYDMP